MTVDTFVRTVYSCLDGVPDISWNSVTESELRALARRLAGPKIDLDAVIEGLRDFLPVGSIDRTIESALRKAFR